MKREITVKVNGVITDEIKDAYHARLAKYLVEKIGVENCLRLVEVLEKDTDEKK